MCIWWSFRVKHVNTQGADLIAGTLSMVVSPFAAFPVCEVGKFWGLLFSVCPASLSASSSSSIKLKSSSSSSLHRLWCTVIWPTNQPTKAVLYEHNHLIISVVLRGQDQKSLPSNVCYSPLTILYRSIEHEHCQMGASFSLPLWQSQPAHNCDNLKTLATDMHCITSYAFLLALI